MASNVQVAVPLLLAFCAIGGSVLRKLRPARSRPPLATLASESAETSKFGQGTLAVSRGMSAALLGMFGIWLWNDHTIIVGGRSAVAGFVWVSVVASLVALSWYVLGLLMGAARRALSFDNDGLWPTQVGKEHGLVRWGEVSSVKESSSALSLFNRDGRLLIEVEYERDGYLRIRTPIMEQMEFRPPELPLDLSAAGANVSSSVRIAFLCAALLCGSLGVLWTSAPGAPLLVPLLFCCAVVFSLLAIPRVRFTVEVDGIRIGRRKYPYSDIRSIEASIFSVYGSQYAPKLTLDVRESRPIVIWPRALGVDSLTLQRTMLWALARTPK